jgi:hypothetical protein
MVSFLILEQQGCVCEAEYLSGIGHYFSYMLKRELGTKNFVREEKASVTSVFVDAHHKFIL